jgi:hypothetical protein
VALNTLQLNMSRALLVALNTTQRTIQHNTTQHNTAQHNTTQSQDVAIVNLQGEKRQLTNKVETATVISERNAARDRFDELLLPVCDASSFLVQQRLEELILAENAENDISDPEAPPSDQETFRRLLNYPVSFKLMKQQMDTQHCHESNNPNNPNDPNKPNNPNNPNNLITQNPNSPTNPQNPN